MRIVLVSDGKYGDRAINNIREHFPNTKLIQLPEYDMNEIIDEVELAPEAENEIKSADLLINYHRHPDVAYEIASYGKPMIQAIYNGQGFLKQLQNEFGTQIIMPTSMCALNPNDFIDSKKEFYEFAQIFGSPAYRIEMYEKTDRIKKIELIRRSPCGSTQVSVELLKDKDINPETINAFALNVRNECREPVSYVINRRGVSDNALLNHIKPLLEEIKKNRPDLFEKGGALENFLEKIIASLNLPSLE